jgi:glycosyltransferase involved in cell wall biosynthesis
MHARLTLAELPPPPRDKTGWPWTAESAQVGDVTPAGFPWPRITVVTPSYNQGNFLEATIRSVLLQGYPHLECIVVDGGSTDDSQEIIDKYRPWLSYAVSEPDDGQYAAINKGFGVSTGAVMTWLNSDDMLVSNSLRVVGEIFAAHGDTVRWLTGISALWDRNGNLGPIANRPRLNRLLLRLGAYDGVTLPEFLQQEGTFWARELWECSGARLDTSLALAADFELWRRLAEHADLYVAPTVLAGFRMHPEQKTAKFMSSYYREIQACRSTGRWGLFERHRPTRWMRRRLARLLYQVQQQGNLLGYDPRSMRWAILRQ